MGIFLNGLSGPKSSPLPSSSKDHFLQFQILYRLLIQDTTLLHQFLSDTHHFLSLDTTHFQLVLVSRYSQILLKLQLPKLARQFQLGLKSILLTLVQIFLLFSYCGLIAFLTFLLSCLSFLHMLPLVCQLVIWLRQ